MNILYVMNGLAVCGGVRVVWHHCLELQGLGHHAVYGVLGGTPVMEWLPGSVPVMLASTARQEKWDLVIATGYETWPMVRDFPSTGIKVGFVQMKEGLFFKDPSVANKAFEIKLGPVITISGWLREWLVALGHKTVEVVPNGVDASVFYHDPWPKPEQGPVALIVGHDASPAKNIADAAKAAREAGCTIWHVSPFNQSPISPDRLWTLPSQDTLRNIYSTADVLVMSSRYEGRSCIPVEAMACGTPVVALDHKGTDDLVGGRAIICKEAGELRSAIEMVLANRELREKMVEEAHKYVLEHLSWPKIGARLEELYTKWSEKSKHVGGPRNE